MNGKRSSQGGWNREKNFATFRYIPQTNWRKEEGTTIKRVGKQEKKGTESGRFRPPVPRL